MAHDLQLFVGRPRALARAAYALGVGAVAALEQGFAALPVDVEVYDALRAYVGRGALARSRRAKRAYFEGDWRREGPLLDAFGSWLSGDGAIAYVETNYFGGSGDQGACAWRRGARVYGPRRGAEEGVINAALAAIGVVAGPGDEFAALGLAARRSNDDFGPARGGPVKRPAGSTIRRPRGAPGV